MGVFDPLKKMQSRFLDVSELLDLSTFISDIKCRTADIKLLQTLAEKAPFGNTN
jgi:hypothetical protein